MAIGLAAIAAMITMVGTWGIYAEIAGAVIGKGKIEISTTMTAVQHPIGGVISKIFVENGDIVEEGQTVLQLDDSQLRSDLKIVEGDLFESLANQARLEAAMEDRKEMLLPPILREAADQYAYVRPLLDRQQRQLTAHYEALESQANLLDEQIKQVEEQIVGVEAELASKTERAVPIGNELQQVMGLADKGLVKLSVLYTLQKEDLTNKGDIGRLGARVAELKGRISELRLKRQTLVPEAKDKLSVELTKVRPEKMRYLEKRNSILDSLSKLDIRTPISGKVHDSKIFGLRSVVVAASPLMYIVPSDLPTLVAVRVFATDIDQVYVGQEASLKFKAFSRRSLPIILGKVTRVSADAFMDTLTQMPYYDVVVELLPDEIAKLGDHELIPGMPVEAFMATESRTPLSYFLKPVVQYFDRAFRDS